MSVFSSKKSLHLVIESQKNLIAEQKGLIEEHHKTHERAIESLVEAEKKVADLQTRLDRLRGLLALLGIDSSEHEDGTALWTTNAVKLLSVQLMDQPEEVSNLLGPNTPDTVKDMALMAAKRLVQQ